MRRARLTYEGAFHHVMNRGYGGRNIFFDGKAKAYFLRVLQEKSVRLGIRVFVYCLMQNHYHLVLQNCSGRLSEFMKQLNGQYGIYYRKRKGGKGYVFQGRFESTLIQEDRYMQMATLYVLLNPVRKKIAEDPYDYRWSSVHAYFSPKGHPFLDVRFVEDMFRDKRTLDRLLSDWEKKDLPVKKTRAGNVLGDDDFVEEATKRFDRRTKEAGSKRMRRHEWKIDPAEEVVRRFEKIRGVRVEKIDASSKEGRRLRDELLVMLKDRAGLTYSQIIEYAPFRGLKCSSLGQLYKRWKAAESEK